MYVFREWEVKENVYKAYIYETFGIYNGGLGVANGFVVARFLLVAIIAKTNRLK